MPTIGVVFTIPDPGGARLQEYRRSLGDETADLIPAHITLIPPTLVPDEQLPQIRTQLGRVAARHPSFEVHLRGTGTFRPTSPVVFVTVAAGIGECEQLAADLRTDLLDLELKFPYHPHVTVAHLLDDSLLDRAFEELVDVDLEFTLKEFHLYVHDPERGWEVLEDFALSG